MANVKLGNKTILGIDTVKLQDADNVGSYVSFTLSETGPNIHYSASTAPTDTSMLWVKTNTIPSVVESSTVIGTILPGTVSELEYSGTKPYVYNLDASGNSNRVQPFCKLLNGNIYIHSSTAKICKYDIQTKTFSTLTRSGDVSYQCMVGSKAYCFSYMNSTIYVYVYDVSTPDVSPVEESASWTGLNNMNAVLYYNSFCVVGTYIYIFNPTTHKIFKLDTVNKTVVTLQETFSLYDSVPVLVDNKIYFMGGRLSYSSTSSRVTYIKIFNTTTDTWRESDITDIFTTTNGYYYNGMSGANATKVGDDIYVFGQYTYANYAEATNAKVSKFNLTNNSVSFIPDLAILDYACYVSCYDDATKSIYIFLYDSDYVLPLSITLEEGKMVIYDSYNSKSFNIINSSDFKVKSYPLTVYIGDSNNEAQKVECALYTTSTSSWENI